MDIRTDIKKDETLRKSFTDLAKSTFGIDLESWYRNGFWENDYIPYCVIEDGVVAANVSVNVCNIRWRGRIRHLAQIGTVMTAPAFRDKGYGKALMEKAVSDCLRSYEGIYLYTEDKTVSYYEQFGFYRTYEYGCHKKVNITTSADAEKIPMDSKDEWDRMVDIIRRRSQYGDRIMVGNTGLFMFHLSGALSDCVYYVPSSEAYAVAKVSGDELTLYAIFADGKVGLGDVISSFGSGIKRVNLAFSPENSTGFDRIRIEDKDNILMTQGSIFDEYKNERSMFPEISHA